MADKVSLDDVAQFDPKLQLAVLDATARVYAAGLEASGSTSGEIRRSEAGKAVDDYLGIVSPLLLGSRKMD